MKRAIVYIDGFNLYHAIDELNKPHLKWLDLWALGQSLLRDKERLEKVYYFSAYPHWKLASEQRHRIYVKALEAQSVTCEMGHFKNKDGRCNSCGATWKRHEEKETDVHMGARLVADAYAQKFDRAILITADSDLLPAIKIVQSAFPEKELFAVAPPKRMAHARGLNPRLEITPGRLAKCRLPDEGRDKEGVVLFACPAEWALPAV
jgi:uncharacterized LabA/DUF88 family protein